jgi:hypothetical protein
LRPEPTDFPQAVGDRMIAGGSADNPWYDRFVAARSSLRICVHLRYLRFFLGGWTAFVSLCLRVCDVDG